MKRWISIVLTLVMLLSALSVSAGAEYCAEFYRDISPMVYEGSEAITIRCVIWSDDYGAAIRTLKKTDTHGYLKSTAVTVKGEYLIGAQSTNYFTIITSQNSDTFLLRDYYGRYIYMTDSSEECYVSEQQPESGAQWRAVAAGDDGTCYIVNTLTEKGFGYDASYGTFGAYAEVEKQSPLFLSRIVHQEEEPEEEIPEGLRYVNSGTEAIVIGYSGSESHLAIPTLIDGFPITGIAASVFSENSSLTSVTIPDTVTVIGESAFSGCNLTTVFYRGSEAQKANMEIGVDNSSLTDATWHYGIEDWTFGEQECYYCAKCDTCFLPNGEYALATVVFKGWEGEIISTQQLKYKETIEIPADPAIPADQADQYMFAGWDSEITVCLGNAEYTAVFAPKIIAGDMDQSGIVDNKDVETLLWHTLFPEDYPINGNADFDGNGVVDNKDVETLLWHTLFPEDYPLI